jgi:hypothetical protein
MGGSNRRMHEEYTSSEYSDPDVAESYAQLAAAEGRLETGPCSGDYEPGSTSEYHTPTAVATPATAFGEPGDTYALEVLTDDPTRPTYEDTNP